MRLVLMDISMIYKVICVLRIQMEFSFVLHIRTTIHASIVQAIIIWSIIFVLVCHWVLLLQIASLMIKISIVSSVTLGTSSRIMTVLLQMLWIVWIMLTLIHVMLACCQHKDYKSHRELPAVLMLWFRIVCLSVKQVLLFAVDVRLTIIHPIISVYK